MNGLASSESDKVLPPAEPKTFDAALPFPHKPPFDLFFAERVPLLLAFKDAVVRFQLNQLKSLTFFEKLRAAFGYTQSQPFNAAECGVYTGSSLIACANTARDEGVDFQFIGLDTFEGLPPLSETDLLYAPRKARYKTRRLFSDTSIDRISDALRADGHGNAVTLHKGLFSETLTKLEERKYHWVNIDCDLYEPHLECLEYFYPRMAKNGVIFFDDYHSIDFPMARVAIEKFMANKPEQLIHLRFGGEGPNRLKAFFLKV
jgi:O-methyltransferase